MNPEAGLMRRMTRPFTVKSISEKGEFSGYGSVFDVKDDYGDMVIKGAFAKSLADWEKQGKLPKMLWQHKIDEPIGAYAKMKEDEHGLYVEGQILVDAGATEKRAYTHLKAGSVDGLSIGYTLAPGGYEYNKDLDAFLLKQINLWEVSIVTFPANTEATVDAVKSALQSEREFERFLRDAGLTRMQAKGVVARGYAGLRDLREAETDDPAITKAAQEFLRALRGLRAKE